MSDHLYMGVLYLPLLQPIYRFLQKFCNFCITSPYTNKQPIVLKIRYVCLYVDTYYIYVCQEKEEPGLMEQVKSEICDNVTLYAQKYEEEFAPSLPTFVNDVWQLLINTGVQVKYDMVRIMQNRT